MKPYVMGNFDINTWRKNEPQQLSFVVTQDCNLRCKYCYMVGKNSEHRMSFETAKKIIRMVKRAEYKRRQGPIGPKMTGMAFGRDWRYPITNKFEE